MSLRKKVFCKILREKGGAVQWFPARPLPCPPKKGEIGGEKRGEEGEGEEGGGEL